MVIVVKGNSEMRVPDTEAAAYLAKGYAAVDEKGNVVSDGKQPSFVELVEKSKNDDRTIRRQAIRIAELEAKVNSLKAELEAKNAENNAESGAKTSTDEQSDGAQANGEQKQKTAHGAKKA